MTLFQRHRDQKPVTIQATIIGLDGQRTHIAFDAVRFMRVVEWMRGQGVYRSEIVRLVDLKTVEFKYDWTLTIFGFDVVLRKFDRTGSSAIYDAYALHGSGWAVHFGWKRESRDAPDQIGALNSYGRLTNVEIMDYEAFQAEWALLVLFEGQAPDGDPA